MSDMADEAFMHLPDKSPYCRRQCPPAYPHSFVSANVLTIAAFFAPHWFWEAKKWKTLPKHQ